MKGKNNMIIYLLFIAYIILSSTGLVIFKLGTTGLGFQIFGFNITLKMIIGIICYGASFLLWLYIVSKVNLTIAMPLSVAFVNTLVVVESCLILKEKITLQQTIGIFLIIIGVMVMTGNIKK